MMIVQKSASESRFLSPLFNWARYRGFDLTIYMLCILLGFAISMMPLNNKGSIGKNSLEQSVNSITSRIDTMNYILSDWERQDLAPRH